MSKNNNIQLDLSKRKIIQDGLTEGPTATNNSISNIVRRIYK